MFLKDAAVRDQVKEETGFNSGDAAFADVSRAMGQRWAEIQAEQGPALQRYQTAAKKAARQFEKAEKGGAVGKISVKGRGKSTKAS